MDANYIIDGISVGSCPWPEDAVNIQQNFDAVLSLTNHNDYINYSDYGILYTHVPFDDGALPTEEELNFCLNFLWSMRNFNQRVLLHCDAGMSRSPFVMAYYIMRTYNMNTDEAIAFIKTKRSIVLPYSGYVYLLRKLAGEVTDAKDTRLAKEI